MVSGGTITLNGTLDNTGTTLNLDTSDGQFEVTNGTIIGGTVTGPVGATMGFRSIFNSLEGVTLNIDVDMTGFRPVVRVVDGQTLNGTATLGSVTEQLARWYRTTSATD